MSFRLPSEIVADEVLPTIRSMLAIELADRGLTQEEVADHLGVTQAAVSAYVAGQVTLEERISEDPRTIDTVDRISEGLQTGEMEHYELLNELVELIREFEDRGPVCELHEEAMPALQGLGCDLCIRGTDTDLSAERAVLTDVRRAARDLANVPGISRYVPNVGANVGMALPGADDIHDVAAVPGRIYTIRGRVEVPANPEFGASEHVATTILAAMRVDGSMRGAVNLSTDDRLLAAARALGVEALAFDPSYDDRLDRLIGRLEDRGSVPQILYHRGAFGIEPILYLVGETASGAVGLVRTLLRKA